MELERRQSIDVTHLEIPAELAVVFSKQNCKFNLLYFVVLNPIIPAGVPFYFVARYKMRACSFKAAKMDSL